VIGVAAMDKLSADASSSTIMTIVLQLARNPGVLAEPAGRSRGYVVTAPLDEAGYLEISGSTSRRWPVRRFGDPDDGQLGWLAHRGKSWFIDYDADAESDNEPIFRLADHRFIVGEYVTITGDEGKALTYRIVSVDPIA
jgi:hypothetical protein